MTIFTNQSKSGAISPTNLQKNAPTWRNPLKAGSAWLYDQVGVTYDGPNDPLTGLPLSYNGEGTLPVFTNLQKS